MLAARKRDWFRVTRWVAAPCGPEPRPQSSIGLLSDIACRRKPSGRRSPAAGLMENGFHGVTRLATARRINEAIVVSFTTSVQHEGITRSMRLAVSRTRHPWEVLPLTVMGCSTWRAMCWSGAGILMELTRLGRSPIPREQQPARFGSFAAGRGAIMPSAAAWPTATGSARRSGATSWDSARPEDYSLQYPAMKKVRQIRTGANLATGARGRDDRPAQIRVGIDYPSRYRQVFI